MNYFLRFLIFASLLVFLIPAHLYRAVYFNVVVEISLFIYLWLLIKNKIKPPKLSLIGVAFFVFILVSALATIFSVEPAKSFWGTPVRSLTGGLFMQLHYFAFFVVLSGVFGKKEDYLKLFKYFLGIGAIIEFYGLFERIYLEQQRIDSLFGNPIYYGIFSIFIFIYFFVIENKKIYKAIYFVVVLLAIAGVYLSSSRGPILGLAVSLILCLPFLIYLGFQKIKIFYPKFNVKIAILGAAIFLVVFLAGTYSLLKDNYMIKRFTNLAQDQSTINRLASWEIALKAIGDKPIFGWGQENFELAFSKHFNPKLITDNVSELWFDRAHNNILDIAVTTGLAGLSAYLAIWFASAIALIRLYKQDRKAESVIFSMLFAAYFISSLTFFDTLITFLPLILILGFLPYLSISAKELELNEKFGKLLQKILLKNENQHVLRGIAMILTISAVFINFKIAKASSYYYEIKFDKNKTFSNLTDYYDKILSINPAIFEAEATYSFARIITGAKIDDEKLIDYIRQTKEKLEKLSLKNKYDIKPLYYGAQVDLLDFNLNGNNNSLNNAKNLLEKSIKIAPNRQDLYMDLAQIHMNLGDYTEAIVSMRAAKDLNIKYLRPQLYLSVLHALDGQNDLAETEFKAILESGFKFEYKDYNNMIFLADWFAEREDHLMAINLLKDVLRLYPKDIKIKKKIASLYAEINDKENAIKQTEEIILIDPASREEAEKFINLINTL